MLGAVRRVKVGANDIKKGMLLRGDAFGHPASAVFKVLEAQHSRQGRGAAQLVLKMRELNEISSPVEKKLRTTEQVPLRRSAPSLPPRSPHRLYAHPTSRQTNLCGQVEVAELEEAKYQYLYADQGVLHFTNFETYDEIQCEEQVLGDKIKWLREVRSPAAAGCARRQDGRNPAASPVRR